ncbi:MAG: long-chain fatty acid--CoA ligase [Chitinophagales bacterium]
MQALQQDWAAKWAVYSPDKIAFKEYETGRTLTYAELNQQGNRLANYLKDVFDIQKGDRIAILAESCLEYILLFVAAQKTGGVLVPMNYRLASAEIDFLLQNAQPKLVIGEAIFQETLEATSFYSQILHKWDIAVIKADCEAYGKGTGAQDCFEVVPVEDDDPIFILYTSGTTGFPKGALYTHKMLFWNSINTAMSLIVNSESRTINCMPPFHTGGWNVFVTPFLHHGGYVCLMKKFDALAVLKSIADEQATIFMGVPTMLKMMTDLSEFETTDFSSLYYIIVGGEPMPIPLIEKWHEKQVPIRQGYGMTEVGPNLTSLHQRDAIRKKGSIGRPNFYVKIRVVDEIGKEVAVNQAGELLLQGPMVTPGYWQNEVATAKAIQNGWFHTGDMVRLDEEGYLYVVDRIKNMYISGGENVYPAEVERVLVTHKAVSEAVVIGVADAKWGETGKAFVVQTGLIEVTEKELQDFCLSKLAKFKVPKSIVFLTELPKNDTGKFNRKILKEFY